MVGKTISHYKILEKLGEGGMGVVYKAHDTTLDRTVALKFLPQYLTSDSAEKERFYHEARAASALVHPNIAVIFEISEFEGQLFLSMELVEGHTLKKLIEGDSLSLKKVLDIAIQASEGLAAAHEKGIVHRDIKSDNIMITSKGQVKIMDFGLAKVKGATKLTKAGSTLGTAAYMSPEQAQGEEVDHRSDIFSFGVVLYELLTTKLPFRGEHQASLMYSLINEEPQPIPRFNENVSPEIERIVLKALAKDREDRYQHVDDLLADLRRERKSIEYAKAGYTRSTMTAQAVPAAVRSKSSWMRYAIPAAVLIVLAALFMVFGPFSLEKNTTGGPAVDRKSIAVLPFSNLSESKEDDAFCDGITEDILTQLSKIGELRVVSRSSIMRYKGTQKSTKEIGKELGVGTILEGSIRRAGNRVRITGQLIDASTDDQIWADSYDRDLKDIFEIQTEVAKNIAGALQAKLSSSEEASIEKKPTDNLEAYGFYTRGRQYYYLYHMQDNEHAIELFKKAVELDPHYALPYAGLGDCYGQRVIKFGYAENWIDSGIAAAQTSVTLDPHLAEGYKALGLCYGSKGYISRALDAYQKAVERNPNYTPAVGNIAILNYQRGDFAESYRWAAKDAKLSAVEPFTYLERGQIYYYLVEDEKAEQWMKKAIELQPDFVFAILMLAHLEVDKGDFVKARAYAQHALSIDSDNPSCVSVCASVELFAEQYAAASELYRKALDKSVRLGDLSFRTNRTGLGFALLKQGKRAEGLKLLGESRSDLETNIERGSESADVRYELAAISSAEGKIPEAYDWMQKAVVLGWRDRRFMEHDPMLANLRNEDRFRKIIGDIRSRVEAQAKLVHDLENQ